MNKKALLTIAVLSVILISGCTNIYENAEAFCKSRGYDGAVHKPFSRGFCIRSMHNDTFEKACYTILNDRYYFIGCDEEI